MDSTVSPDVQPPTGGGKPCGFEAHPRAAACAQPAKQSASTAAAWAGTTVTSAATASAACVPNGASMGAQGSSLTPPAGHAATAAARQDAEQLLWQCSQRICACISDQKQHGTANKPNHNASLACRLMRCSSESGSPRGLPWASHFPTARSWITSGSWGTAWQCDYQLAGRARCCPQLSLSAAPSARMQHAAASASTPSGTCHAASVSACSRGSASWCWGNPWLWLVARAAELAERPGACAAAAAAAAHQIEVLGWDVGSLTCKSLQAGAAQATSFDILPQLLALLRTLLTCPGACMPAAVAKL